MEIVRKRIDELRPGEIVVLGGQVFKVGRADRDDNAPETHTRVWDKKTGLAQLECRNDHHLTVVEG